MSAQPPTPQAHAPAPPKIFDPKRLRAQRGRASPSLGGDDFIHARVLDDIVARLEMVNRAFSRALFFGADAIEARLTNDCGVGQIVHTDCAPTRLSSQTPSFAFDQEAWPVKPGSLDLVVSVLALHHANDLIGALTQARRSLRPDGLFIAAVFGEGTLNHFRHCLTGAEADIRGGIAQRFSPLASVQDYGQALGRARFAMPVVDSDTISVRYNQPHRLLDDLRAIGERAPLLQLAGGLRKDVLAQALMSFGQAPTHDGACDAGEEKFEIFYLTGWAPARSQPKPLKPGSATTALQDAVLSGAKDI